MKATCGFALIPVLLVLSVLAGLGLTSTQTLLLQNQTLQAQARHTQAYHAAQAALDDALQDMAHATGERAQLLQHPSDPLWPEGCGSAPWQGLCGAQAAWSADDAIPYGAHTQRTWPHAQPPRYRISPWPPDHLRISAIGYPTTAPYTPVILHHAQRITPISTQGL